MEHKNLWWLSFADPELPKGSQFLGVVIIKAKSMEQAHLKATKRGLNPGGEIAGFNLDLADDQESMKRLIKPHHLNCLLDKQTLFREFEVTIMGEWQEKFSEEIPSHEKICRDCNHEHQ